MTEEQRDLILATLTVERTIRAVIDTPRQCLACNSFLDKREAAISFGGGAYHRKCISGNAVPITDEQAEVCVIYLKTCIRFHSALDQPETK